MPPVPCKGASRGLGGGNRTTADTPADLRSHSLFVALGRRGRAFVASSPRTLRRPHSELPRTACQSRVQPGSLGYVFTATQKFIRIGSTSLNVIRVGYSRVNSKDHSIISDAPSQSLRADPVAAWPRPMTDMAPPITWEAGRANSGEDRTAESPFRCSAIAVSIRRRWIKTNSEKPWLATPRPLKKLRCLVICRLFDTT